jgi:acylphosphatase
MIARRLVVRGVVQGVGYRYAMVEMARSLRVAGWVRNRRDGSVEAVVSGAPEAVDRIVEWSRRGPRSAVVANVQVSDASGSYGSFETLPTE